MRSKKKNTGVKQGEQKKKQKQKKHFKPPTLEQIERYIDSQIGIRIYPEYVYKFFAARRWKMPNGKRIQGIPSMVNYLEGQLRSSHPIPSIKPAQKLKKSSSKAKYKGLSYEQLLELPEWKEFREKVMAVRGDKCEKCGSQEIIQIHHIRYISGRLPWKYPISMMRVLCRDCHRKEHHIDDAA